MIHQYIGCRARRTERATSKDQKRAAERRSLDRDLLICLWASNYRSAVVGIDLFRTEFQLNGNGNRERETCGWLIFVCTRGSARRAQNKATKSEERLSAAASNVLAAHRSTRRCPFGLVAEGHTGQRLCASRGKKANQRKASCTK